MGITGCCNKSEKQKFLQHPREFSFPNRFSTHSYKKIAPPACPSGPGDGHPKPTRPLCPGAVSPARRQRDVTRTFEREKRRNRECRSEECRQQSERIGSSGGLANGALARMRAGFSKSTRGTPVGKVSQKHCAPAAGESGSLSQVLLRLPRFAAEVFLREQLLAGQNPNGSRSLGQHCGCKLSVLSFKDPKNSITKNIYKVRLEPFHKLLH